MTQRSAIIRATIFLLSVLALTAVGLPVLTAAPATGQDTQAVAVNEKDGKSVFKLAFQVKRTMDSDVDADNTAIAYASCTECETVAAAIQVVLVMDEPTSVDAENVAVAINYDCTECETLAAAYQFVFGDGQPVHFSAEGNRRLADIRRRFQALRQRDDLTLQQLANQVAALAAETAAVVATETVPTGREGAPGQQEATTTTTAPTGSASTVAPPPPPTSTETGDTSDTTAAPTTESTTAP